MAKQLPILQIEDKIKETVQHNPVVVIIGETGSGKSTQLSQILHRSGYSDSGLIAVTQPRRVAAVTVSRRVSEELGVRLGDEVGYSIRFEDRTSEKTRIKYLTDGVLLRKSLLNPEMNQYSVIILDEAHERSLNMDILLGLMKRLIKLRASNLKVLITSATLNGEKVSKFFCDCPILNVPGKLFPVEILYSSERPKSYLVSCLKVAVDIHVREPEGDILIFMKGQDDIPKLVSKLEEKIMSLEEGSCMDAIALPLHGSLPPELQIRVFSPPPPNCRRFIVATNIAETSLTVDGVVNISPIINHTSRMSWADLPIDILFIIFGFLHNIDNFNIIDLYQCLAVCRSWRLVAKQIWQNRILPTTPWLVSTIDASSKIVFNTNLHKCHNHPPSLDTNNSDARFPCALDLLNLSTYASFDGWLLLGNSNNLPFLYNPITLALLQLPPLPMIHLLHYHMKFVSSGASPTDHDCIICLKFSNAREFKNDFNNFLAFCRPASSTSWVLLHEKAEDFLFSGGKFYTIGSDGDLFIYNSEIINDNASVRIGQPWKKKKIADAVFNSNSLLGSNDCCFFYLLESKHRELLMIMREIEEENLSTTSFRVFKLNRSCNNYNSCWKEISSLPENESIILLWNDGVTISVDDHNGYKSNCIYFYDEDTVGQITTYGIHDLGNRKINYRPANQYSGDEALYNFNLFTPCKISDV